MSMNTPPVKVETELQECDWSGCIDGEHQWVNGVVDEECHSQRIGDGSPGNSLWLVTGYWDSKLGHWRTHAVCHMDEVFGVYGLLEYERFLLAYRAVQNHCDQLNAHVGDYLIALKGGRL